MLYCKDLTTEQRYEIKDILGEYVISADIHRYRSLDPVVQSEDALHFVREIILNPDKTIVSLSVAELAGFANLRNIIRNNKDTDIARRNDFHVISTLEAWQFRMPLTDVKFYKALIDLQSRVGRNELLTSAPAIIYFKTQAGVLLPCTEEHLRIYHEAINEILTSHNNLLLSVSKPIQRKTNDGAVVDTLYSAIVKAYFKHHYFEDGKFTARFASPIETYFAQSDADYRKLVVEALAKKDMDQLVAFTCEEVTAFFRYIEENWQSLLSEVQCTAERHEELKEILSSGFDVPVATKLWPNHKRSVAFGSGEHYEAFQQMKRYTGDLSHNHGYYFTEEAILGKAVADDSDLFECIKGVNFYELLPLATDAAPVFWTQVEMGKPYQLIVTNNAGLYRYTTDHFICPQKVSLSSIEFTIY